MFVLLLLLTMWKLQGGMGGPGPVGRGGAGESSRSGNGERDARKTSLPGVRRIPIGADTV